MSIFDRALALLGLDGWWGVNQRRRQSLIKQNAGKHRKGRRQGGRAAARRHRQVRNQMARESRRINRRRAA
jgi:hypothetical protein